MEEKQANKKKTEQNDTNAIIPYQLKYYIIFK